MTDCERILALFRNSFERRINVNEIVDGKYFGSKKIIEYSGRITDAREEMGCTCGKDKKSCTASEHIINVKRNWYQYRSDKVEVKKEVVKPVNIAEVTRKLAILKEEYRKAQNDADKKLIEVRGKALRMSLEDKRLESQVVQALF